MFGHGGHLGSHLDFRMKDCFENVFVGRNEYLDPSNPTLETKIIVLCGMVMEICDLPDPGGHFGSHLEFGTTALRIFVLAKMNSLTIQTPP